MPYTKIKYIGILVFSSHELKKDDLSFHCFYVLIKTIQLLISIILSGLTVDITLLPSKLT